MIQTSIIPGMLLVLLAWSAHARSILYTDDDSALLPIMSQSRRTRICHELCISGLGGTPCGDTCYDLIPTTFPVKAQEHNSRQVSSNSSSSSSKTYNATAREDSCNVLCKNKLGYPLCSCNYDDQKVYTTDFVEVCSTFCVNYNYQIVGCHSCGIYVSYYKSPNNSTDPSSTVKNLTQNALKKIDFTMWCKYKCENSDGGAACNCQSSTQNHLYGCQNCSLYKQYVKTKSNSNSDFHTASLSLQSTLEVEWPVWCRQVCSNGNGGAACQCDLLP